MLKSKVVKFYACWLFVLVGLMNIQTIKAQTIRLTSGEWPPYMSEHSLKHNGLISRIVTEAFALEGIKVEYGYFPWNRSLKLAREGLWDGSIGWAMERNDLADDFWLSDPTNTVPRVLFYRKDKPILWQEIDDLKGKSIGITASYFYGDLFENAKAEGVFSVQSVIHNKQNLIKLRAGRIDAFIMGVDAGLHLIRSNLTGKQIDEISYNPKALATTYQSVILSKKNPQGKAFIKAFNLGLKKLKETGKLAQYIEESRQGLYILNP